MSPRSKILNHPSKEDIIKWLTEGISVREISSRLSQKYPRKNQEHLRVGPSTIQGFKAKHLNIKGKVLDVIFEDKSLSNFCKAKVLVTKNNIYTFFTSYKKGTEEKHNFFTKSFHISS